MILRERLLPAVPGVAVYIEVLSMYTFCGKEESAVL